LSIGHNGTNKAGRPPELNGPDIVVAFGGMILQNLEGILPTKLGKRYPWRVEE
jgi:hypothetical protein